MGLNKGKNIMWLSMHVGVYLATLLTFGMLFGEYVIDTTTGMFPIIEYCILNAVLHWITDFFTSKISGWCYLKMIRFKESGKRNKELFWQYNFWGMIGFDQLIHTSTLLITYQYFFV
jgi:hypothetical protein